MATLRAGTVAVPHLRAWREHRLLTRAQLADKSGVSEAGIEKLESGRAAGARFTTVVKLAQALGVTTETLLTTSPDIRVPESGAKRLSARRRRAALTSDTTPAHSG
jgi:transcriptional regulator with XRE-family HTH domain